MQTVLKFLPMILTAAPALIQLVENAFGGQVSDQAAHQAAVVNLLLTLVKDAAQLAPNSRELQFAEVLVNDLAGPAIKAFYDTKAFMAGKVVPATA